MKKGKLFLGIALIEAMVLFFGCDNGSQKSNDSQNDEDDYTISVAGTWIYRSKYDYCGDEDGVYLASIDSWIKVEDSGYIDYRIEAYGDCSREIMFTEDGKYTEIHKHTLKDLVFESDDSDLVTEETKEQLLESFRTKYADKIKDEFATVSGTYRIEYVDYYGPCLIIKPQLVERVPEHEYEYQELKLYFIEVIDDSNIDGDSSDLDENGEKSMYLDFTDGILRLNNSYEFIAKEE